MAQLSGSEIEGKTMKETYLNSKVTYTLNFNDKLYVIENVPVRICKETGEQFFSPETVEHIQTLFNGKTHPKKTIQTPVYDYVA
jgi:YgiT-type zinc finger domain-containing protein